MLAGFDDHTAYAQCTFAYAPGGCAAATTRLWNEKRGSKPAEQRGTCCMAAVQAAPGGRQGHSARKGCSTPTAAGACARVPTGQHARRQAFPVQAPSTSRWCLWGGQRGAWCRRGVRPSLAGTPSSSQTASRRWAPQLPMPPHARAVHLCSRSDRACPPRLQPPTAALHHHGTPTQAPLAAPCHHTSPPDVCGDGQGDKEHHLPPLPRAGQAALLPAGQPPGVPSGGSRERRRAAAVRARSCNVAKPLFFLPRSCALPVYSL